MIKRSKKNWTQCLDVSMSSFSGEKRIKFDNLICIYFYIFITSYGIYSVVNFILSSLENDDMESSKHCVQFSLLVFIKYIIHLVS